MSLQVLFSLPLGLYSIHYFSQSSCFATHVCTIAACFAVVPITKWGKKQFILAVVIMMKELAVIWWVVCETGGRCRV